MNASGLLNRIRGDLGNLSEYIAWIERVRQAGGKDPSGIISLLGDYNYTTYTEICHRDGVSPDFKLDPATVEEFENAMDVYLTTYAPGKADLKCYVSNISLYLTFIAKRPLHPPGVPFSDEIRIVKNGDFYYCSGKKQFLDDPSSLCRYCVCRQG
jgi:uncharacterized protein (UPF0305 family)